MNRPRKRGNRDLPQGLYAENRGGVVYYVYRHPKTGKRHGMGTNRTQAILATQQLNSMLITPTDLVDTVLGRSNLFAAWLDRYVEIRLSEKKLSEKTVTQLKHDVKTMRAALGAIPVGDITVFHCSEYLDQWLSAGKRRMAGRMRSSLIKAFEYAAAHGLVDSNPADKTLPITVQVKRRRLTKEQFDAIYALAAPHIQNAMMLALITLQRREDIAAMKFSDVKDGHLYVAQQKTGKDKRGRRADSTNAAAHLMIEVTPQLQRVISQCRKTGIVSRYIIHQLYRRRAGGVNRHEINPGDPLREDNLTRAFGVARDNTGLFDGIPVIERPTFHEIRSLGAKLYRDQGINPQALLGHTNEKMTKHYLDGHGIEWTIVSANLAI